jgi:hypothetical protein
MEHHHAAFSTVLAVAASMSTIVATAADAQTRGVIELFTSQGCSSCPPADEVLGELARDPSIVAMSLPIDYWDYLGWKDTLAKPRHSARQRGYAHQRGDREVYTPQVVVNGAVHVLGSDKAAIEDAMAQTRTAGAMLSLPIRLALSDGNLAVTVQPATTEGPSTTEDPSATEGPSAEVWLCALTKTVPVEIGRGENHGRTITYHNVVRHWLKLGDFSGADLTWSVPLSEIVADDSDEAVVLVQQGTREKPGPILGAALAPLAPLASAVEAH